MTLVSAERVGLGNYTVKRDWRFDIDVEVRREGDISFNPPAGTAGSHPLPSGIVTNDPVTLTFTARRPNGQTAFICGTATKLFRYFYYEDDSHVASGYTVSGYFADETGIWLEIGSGFSTSGHRWEARNVNGVAVFNNGYDLPVSYRLEESRVRPIYELREQGIACVDTIEELNGILLLFGITEIASDYLPVVLNGSSPYGAFRDAGRTSQNRYKKIWSGLGAATRFGASTTGTMAKGSTSLVLATPMASLVAGDEIIILGAALDGGNLVTKIKSISGASVEVANYAVTAVAGAIVAKSDIEGLIVGSYELQDDASPILRGVAFQDRIVVFKASGTIFVGQYTGDAGAPFSYSRVHRSPDGQSVDAPSFRWAIASVQGGRYLLYPGRNHFFSFDLVNQRPVPHPKLALCDDVFFSAVDQSNVEQVFSVDVLLTNETWFCFPGGADSALCFDHKFNKVSTLGTRYTSGVVIARPQAPSVSMGEAEDWLVLGAPDGSLLQYGLFAAGSVWTRRGVSYTSEIRAGRGDFGDRFNEKSFTAYLMLLGSASPDSSVTVEFYGATNPGGSIALLETRVFANPQSRNMAYTHRLFHLIQDRILATGATNVTLSERVFEIEALSTRGIVR